MTISNTQKLTLAAMATALTVLFMYVAYVIPSIKIACLFISSIFVYALLSDNCYLSAILTFVASALLTFLIVPNKVYAIAYVGLVGHYAIFKSFIDTHVSSKIIGSCVKLLYCNIFFALALVLAMYVFKIQIPEIDFPKWAIILLAEVLLVVVDFVQTLCFHLYDERIKRFLMPRR